MVGRSTSETQLLSGTETPKRAKIFFAAGEVSGDKQAAYLAEAILEQDPNAQLFGSGGDRMREAGIDVRIHTVHLGCVGVLESVRYLRPLRGVLSQIKKLILQERPDVAVLVDNEGFNGLLAKFLVRQKIPVIYYFAPQVWLWAPWRAKTITKTAHTIISAFSTEAEVYRKAGGRVMWLGHPLVDVVKADPHSIEIFQALGLNPSERSIALMPGSRFHELEQLAPRMLVAAKNVLQRHPSIQVIIPLAAPHLKDCLEAAILKAGLQGKVKIIDRNVYTCLSRCEAVLVSAGTATLETALLGVPMIVTYRFTPLTYWLVRWMVHTRFIAMPNILLNRKVVPELVQQDATIEKMTHELLQILENPAHARAIKQELIQIPPILGSSGVLARAARLILNEAHHLQNLAGSALTH